MMRRRQLGVVPIILLFLLIARPAERCRAATFHAAIRSTAHDLADFLDQKGTREVQVRFEGLRMLPGGNRVGFVDTLTDSLADREKQISPRARYEFVSHLVRTDNRHGAGFRARLVGEVLDARGRIVHRIMGQEIDDGKELAEAVGLSADFGQVNSTQIRQVAFRRAFDEKTIHVDDQTPSILLGGEGSPFGVQVLVNGQPAKIDEEVQGLANVDLPRASEYAVVLYNMSDMEVAVDVRIDGLNRFHFSEPAFRENGELEGKPKYKYRVIPPRSSSKIAGWFKTHDRKTRFKITPLDESAAVKAGIPLDDVGMISATFYASWEQKSAGWPSDEPKVARRNTTTGSVKERGRLSDGSVYEGVLHEPEERVATGFGAEATKMTQGVERVIGAPQATVVIRYGR